MDSKCDCNDGYFDDATENCAACNIPGCAKCNSPGDCSICKETEHWVPENNTHCECDKSFYQVNTNCFSCSVIKGCIRC